MPTAARNRKRKSAELLKHSEQSQKLSKFGFGSSQQDASNKHQEIGPACSTSDQCDFSSSHQLGAASLSQEATVPSTSQAEASSLSQEAMVIVGDGWQDSYKKFRCVRYNENFYAQLVPSNGACFFSSLGHQLQLSLPESASLRSELVDFIRTNHNDLVSSL